MTIQQAKDQAAIRFGYKNYQDAIIKITTNKSGDINHVIDIAMQNYADVEAKEFGIFLMKNCNTERVEAGEEVENTEKWFKIFNSELTINI